MAKKASAGVRKTWICRVWIERESGEVKPADSVRMTEMAALSYAAGLRPLGFKTKVFKVRLLLERHWKKPPVVLGPISDTGIEMAPPALALAA